MRGDASKPEDWLAFARRDLEWARKDVFQGDSSRAMATLQQAAEKALKGWLIAREWDLIKTHDLGGLARAAIERGADLEWFLPAAVTLTEEYFAERYPGDFDPPSSEQEIVGLIGDVEKLLTELFPEDHT